jgi:uncharacterized protein YejL (UPF0352 family)
MQKLIFSLLLCLFSCTVMAEEWAFDVYLDKNKIGTHTFKLDEAKLLTSKAKFKVKVLFIEAYKYDHSAKEQWQNDCLANLEAHTAENKVTTDVKGAMKGNAFEVAIGKTSQNLPACTMTFAYWNPKILSQSKLLNPQNAEYLDTTFENLGTETISVKGAPTEASHYKLSGAINGKNKLKIELWYTQNQAGNKQWVALKSTTPEGYIINYKLI